ncbi:MAG: Fur family transcriptional regulator [Pseudomonadota bacterium]
MTDKTLVEKLRDLGVSITPQRRVLCEILEATEAHLDAEGLRSLALLQQPRITLATVYRLLNDLEEHGLVHRHHFGEGRHRYEIAIGKRHGHLVEQKTMHIVEFETDAIEKRVRRQAESLGYELVHFDLVLYGRRTG